MRLLLNPATAAWLVLLAATGVSGTVAETHRGMPLAALFIAGIVAVKVEIIMQHFMELKDGPIIWRVIMRTWLVVVTSIVASGFVRLYV